MSTELLTVLMVVLASAVIVALVATMWLEHRSRAERNAAIVAGVVLAVWAALACALALRGVLTQSDTTTVLPLGVYFLVVFAGLAAALTSSRSLRSLLSNQRNLIRLNVWRLVGFIFLLLMADGQMPALWALPAGIGDILIGITAFWVARELDSPGGRQRAVIFNLLGLADLVVAVGLGMATSPGPAQLFHTMPTSELATHFPLALVPGFLVPLAFVVHIVSLWQLLGGSWSPAPSPLVA